MNMKGTKRKFSRCETCERFDYKDMVQCDNCDDWYHYRCVGVGPEIVDLNWSCVTCSKGKKNFSIT